MRTSELTTGPPVTAVRNLTLASLPRTLYDKLSPHLFHVDLPQGFVLVKSEREIQWIYFLERGMGSMNSMDIEGTPVEVGIIGREGIVGVQALLGQHTTQNMTIMQGAGDGFRIRADYLRDQCSQNEVLLQAVHTFVFALIEQTTQLILCNRLHDLEARLARWLLMCSDLMEMPVLHLTQEYLAEMLGVGRPAVTIAAGILQRSGLIVYSRGVVEIMKRDQLEEVSCACYGTILAAYRRLYPAL